LESLGYEFVILFTDQFLFLQFFCRTEEVRHIATGVVNFFGFCISIKETFPPDLYTFLTVIIPPIAQPAECVAHFGRGVFLHIIGN